MAVQINVAANQAALTASIQAGVQAYNQKFAQNNQINLSVNQRAFSQPLGRMTGDVKDFEAALAASNARVIAFGASTAVLGGVIRSFKELANVTIEVEKSLADINRVFGLTTNQLQKFSTDLFSVSKQTASTFDDASKAALEFSRQGLKAEDVLVRTKDALTLTRLAGIGTANAVDALTSTVNGFASTGITTTQILNKLVAVEQDYAVGAGDLAEALSRTGQAAQEAGVSLDQLNALVTAAQQSTARGGAVIGNALKTIFTRLQRNDTLDQLEAFNIAVRDVEGNTLPAVQILQNFAGAYKGLADAQRAQLSEQVAGVYQVNILKAIVGDLNKSQGVYAGALQRGASATNEAEVATAKLNLTLDALLKQTATSTQQLANNIGKVTFEPLAKYGAQQLKSFVENINEVLEGEGAGSTFANGLLKGIRNVIAGPGAIAAFFTLFKLIQNSFTYLSQALPQIAGITTETQNRKNIEQSILQIMQQQGPAAQALSGLMGNQAAQAQLLLQIARQQTAEYQMQSTLAKQLAAQLAGQGVRVKGSGGLQVNRAGGYIPNATRMAEVVGAQAGGYAPGQVVNSPVGGVMNTAESVKYIPGFAQPFINPPANSDAGRAHRQNAINRTGVDPYMYGGFIPNFGLKTLGTVRSREWASKTKQTNLVTSKTNTGPKYDDLFAANIVKKQFDLPYGFFKNMARTIVGEIYNDKNQLQSFIDQYKNKVDPSSLAKTETALKNIKNTAGFSNALNQVQGLLGEAEAYDELKQDGYTSAKGNQFFDLSAKDGRFAEVRTRQKISINDIFQKAISQYLSTTNQSYRNTNNDFIDVGSYDVISPSGSPFFSKGFIPNFAPPTSAIRVPWFKKFGNSAFDAIQPTLGISKASDVDTFRQVNFRSSAKGADKVGDNNIFAPLYEDFVFKAMQLVSQSKIKDQLIRGYALQPGTDQKQSAFDAFLGDIALEYKGFPKANLTGSISGNLNDKYERFAKANPAGAAKIKESIITFNELGHENQLPSAFGKTFSQLAGTSYSQMAKSSPDLVKGLSAETNSLLNSYVKNPAFLAMASANGFIPNFADFIDVDTLTKNSVHYSGDLMKLIKDIESSIGRNLSSGELRFLSSPKTDLSKLNDPKVLNRFINSERKGGFAGFAKGFLPNFAYKQAVMGLEESMSGNKAIFDTKPFPHIRNSSQPTFSSAIADHGGLSNALSDSMRGQKAAGLMSAGFVPNFADTKINVKGLLPNAPKNWDRSIENLEKALSQLADELIKNKTKVSQYSSELSKLTGNNKILNNILPQVEKQLIEEVAQRKKEALNQKLSSAATTLAFAGPIAAGLIEQAVYGKKERTEMTAGERVGQSVLSSGLTSLSTGASIGASFGPWGAAIGAAAGAAVGLAQALGAASLSADEFAKIAEEYKSTTQQNISAGQSYIDTLKLLGTSTDPEVIKKATTSLELNFKNIKDVKLQDAFKAAGNDVNKLTTALTSYEEKRGKIEAQKSSLAQSKALGQLSIQDLGKRGYQTVKSGPRNAIDIAANEANFSRLATEYSAFFDNINNLTENQYKQFKDALNTMDYAGNVDEDNLRKVLMTFSQLDTESVDYLVAIGENLTELGSSAGRVLRTNLDKTREAYRKNLEQGKGVLSDEQKTVLSNFAQFRRTLLDTVSDDLDNAVQALKSFESKTSFAQLVPAKLKEINDLVFNAVVNNLDSVRGFSFKQSQARTAARFQTEEFNRLTGRTITEQGLKTAQTSATFKNQATQAILGSKLIPGMSSQKAISDFLSTGTSLDKEGIKKFATSIIGKNEDEINALSSKLEGVLTQFKDATRETESQTKYKLQELAYNQVINKISEATILKQIDLEKEKLSITLGQKNAANGLRDAVEKAKISANERLELTKIQTGGEFRYLGLNKRQEFESKQVDLKSIFDQEQVIAENQAIADARRSIIEIAAQNANTEAQNKNTEALFDSIDSSATNFENLGNILSNLPFSGMKEVGSGFVTGAQEAKAKNKINRDQFQKSRESVKLAEISNFGVSDDATINDAINKLKTKRDAALTEETKASIQETITTLEIASKQIGSNATLFEAKAAQMRNDFEQSAGFVNNMAIGFQSLNNQADVMVDQLGRNLPSMFADGLVDGVKAAIKESHNLGDALMGIASKFLDEISTTFMRAGMYKILGSAGFGEMLMKQEGGIIRAQSGMYISGTGTGDKYPALLENGEYVLNRRAVAAMGGPSVLDSLNFSMAPRFAAGGSYNVDLSQGSYDYSLKQKRILQSNAVNLGNMEANMTSEGLENSPLYKDILEAQRQNQQEQLQKKIQRRQQRAAMIGQLAAAAATIAIGAGLSNVMKNAQAAKAKAFTEKINSQGGIRTEAEYLQQKQFVKQGLMTADTPLNAANYLGGTPQTGFKSLFSAPTYGQTWYQKAGSFVSSPFRRQTGGIIGSRLSDTIPGYMEGGLYNTPIVNRYGAGMQNGGSSMMAAGNSSSITNNNTNANNSFNFNTTVERDGTIKMGSNTTSYEQQDVELSKNLNQRVYAVVSEVIRKEKQFGGSLAGVRS